MFIYSLCLLLVVVFELLGLALLLFFVSYILLLYVFVVPCFVFCLVGFVSVCCYVCIYSVACVLLVLWINVFPMHIYSVYFVFLLVLFQLSVLCYFRYVGCVCLYFLFVCFGFVCLFMICVAFSGFSFYCGRGVIYLGFVIVVLLISCSFIFVVCDVFLNVVFVYLVELFVYYMFVLYVVIVVFVFVSF